MEYTFNTAPSLHASLMAAAINAPTSKQWKACDGFITFKAAGRLQDGSRPSFKIKNARENLEAFAGNVARAPRLFGGGKVDTGKSRKAAPAITWPAQALKVAREFMEEKTASGYAAALDIAADKLGALFYIGAPGKTFAMFAPVPCDEIPGMHSGMREDGVYVVFDKLSGLSVDGATRARSRARAIECAVTKWERISEDKRTAAMARAHAKPCDQAEALGQWKLERGLMCEEEIQTHLAMRDEKAKAAEEAEAVRVAAFKAALSAELAAESKAAQHVAQVVAGATAAAAIEAASLSAALGAIAHTEATQAPAQAQELETVAALEGAQHGSTGAHYGHALSATPSGRHPEGGQQIKSKSGLWSARFFSTAAGLPALEFTQAGRAPCIVECETGAQRMRILQQSARMADDAAKQAAPATQAPSAAEPEAKRAPRPYVDQVMQFDLRGITWKIEVFRYWKIDSVPEDKNPDCLVWRAYKKGGRYQTTQFSHVPVDKVPLDVAKRASEFHNDCAGADRRTKSMESAAKPRRQYAGEFKNVTQAQARKLWEKGEPIACLTYKRATLKSNTEQCACDFTSFDDKIEQTTQQLRHDEKLYFYAPSEAAPEDTAADYTNTRETSEAAPQADAAGLHDTLRDLEATSEASQAIEAQGNFDELRAQWNAASEEGRRAMIEGSSIHPNVCAHSLEGFGPAAQLEVLQAIANKPATPATPEPAQTAPQASTTPADSAPRVLTPSELIEALQARGFFGVVSGKGERVVLARKGDKYGLQYSNTTQAYKSVAKLAAAGIAADVRGWAVVITGLLEAPQEITRKVRAMMPQDAERFADDAGRWECFLCRHGERFSVISYFADAFNPTEHYTYKTEDKARAAVAKFATWAEGVAAEREKRKQERRATMAKPHGLQVGDIVRSSWGYDQTNIDYFQITKLCGARTVEVRAVAQQIEGTGHMSGNCVPVPGKFIGEAMRRTVDAHGSVNILSATYGRASKIEPAIVGGVKCYAPSGWSSYA